MKASAVWTWRDAAFGVVFAAVPTLATVTASATTEFRSWRVLETLLVTAFAVFSGSIVPAILAQRAAQYG